MRVTAFSPGRLRRGRGDHRLSDQLAIAPDEIAEMRDALARTHRVCTMSAETVEPPIGASPAAAISCQHQHGRLVSQMAKQVTRPIRNREAPVMSCT
jgi:hypothetical protein